MTKLIDLVADMTRYNNQVAYGSECNAWQDFVASTFDTFGFAPWSDRAIEEETEAGEDFAEYWIAVAEGRSTDYAANTGARND